ncbi:AraC family transcriptional regulator [Amycolatopsis thermoflava]|uniref:AraC family transcriptional regulator n=1 Tax=Amycolatopsis thermoflava TaxID=84480 RepID=UPI00365B6F36
MSMVLPLQRYEVCHSSDPDTVQAAIEPRFCPHSLRLTPHPGRLDARLHVRPMHQVTVHYVSYGHEVHLGPAELASFYVVGLPISGEVDVTCGRQRFRSVPGTASLLNATEPVAMRWSADSAQVVIRIERKAVEAELRRLLHAPLPRPVLFRLAITPTNSAIRNWLCLVKLLLRDLETDSPYFRSPPTVGDTERMLISRLLFAQPHNYATELMTRLRARTGDAVEQAVALIDAAPEAPHTVPALAQQVGISVRRLQEAFRQRLGMPPTEYVRMVRLEHAHDDLVAFTPHQRTVAEIATKWGFTHLSRFSALYRDRYGEHPIRTLKRGVSIEDRIARSGQPAAHRG